MTDTTVTPKIEQSMLTTLAIFVSVLARGDLPEPTYITSLGNPSTGTVVIHVKTHEDFMEWISYRAARVIRAPEETTFPWNAAIIEIGGLTVEVAHFPKDYAKEGQ